MFCTNGRVMFLTQFSPSLFVSDCCTEACHLFEKCRSRDPLVIIADGSDLSTLTVLRKHPDS